MVRLGSGTRSCHFLNRHRVHREWRWLAGIHDCSEAFYFYRAYCRGIRHKPLHRRWW